MSAARVARPCALRRGCGCFSFITILALGIALALLLYQSSEYLEVSRMDIALERLPAQFDGFKILHLSDLHAKRFGNNNHRLFDAVAAEKPDIIVITGDLVNDASAESLEYARELLTALLETAPVYYVSGNHEWSEPGAMTSISALITDLGADYIDNRAVLLERGGDTVVLLGFMDPNGPYDKLTMSQTTELARSKYGDGLIIALAHRYHKFDEYVELGLDLVLTGHGHGGVIRLPFTDGLLGMQNEWFPKHVSGATRENGTVMVTSRGLGGQRGAPRLFNRPEIVVEILRSGD